MLAALTLATSSLSSGSELRLAVSISAAALAGSAATPSDTAVGLLQRKFTGQGGRGHFGLVGQATAGLEGPLGGRRAHAGLVGELLRC